jgi:hypothetical protein
VLYSSNDGYLHPALIDLQTLNAYREGPQELNLAALDDGLDTEVLVGTHDFENQNITEFTTTSHQAPTLTSSAAEDSA